MTAPLVGVPVKPFGVAKSRLAPRLDAAARRRLGQALALRTASRAAAAGGEPAIVTGDDGVAAWAGANRIEVIPEPAPSLDAAASAVVAAAALSGRPWLIVHADLPLVTEEDLAHVMEIAAADRMALAPARDGGTNVLAGSRRFRFAYGPDSFHRHLRRAGSGAVVVTTVSLALDLDTLADLAAAAAHPDGEWLTSYFTPALSAGGTGT